jgi:hypothetical protein
MSKLHDDMTSRADRILDASRKAAALETEQQQGMTDVMNKLDEAYKILDQMLSDNAASGSSTGGGSGATTATSNAATLQQTLPLPSHNRRISHCNRLISSSSSRPRHKAGSPDLSRVGAFFLVQDVGNHVTIDDLDVVRHAAFFHGVLECCAGLNCFLE